MNLFIKFPILTIDHQGNMYIQSKPEFENIFSRETSKFPTGWHEYA
jgi:hypothetical protein